jgi:membrane-bound ClpP family serine protease
MSTTLSVRISVTKRPNGDVYEGTASPVGARPTKLVRKADNSTQFPTRSAVVANARNWAKSHGYNDVTFVEAGATKASAPAKKAAKKSAVTSTKTATKNTVKRTSTATTPTRS